MAMRRRQFVSGLAAGAMMLVLSGCSSFAPVYGDMSSSGMAAARFNFAPPTNRLEQVILNRLAIAFPGPATASDPVLSVSATAGAAAISLSNAVAVGRPIGTQVAATVTISQDRQVVFTADRFTDTAYQSGKLTPTDLQSANGALESAARSTAESLRAAILGGYRPSMVPARR